jgi:hypothetical protein
MRVSNGSTLDLVHRSSRATLRRSLLGVFVTDLAVIGAVVALAIPSPAVRLAAVMAAVFAPALLFGLARRDLGQSVITEVVFYRARSVATCLGVLLGTIALASAVGLHSTGRDATDLAGQQFGGPIDLFIDAPDAATGASARRVLDGLRATPGLQTLFDAEPVDLQVIDGWLTGVRAEPIRFIVAQPSRLRGFGGERAGNGLEGIQDGPGIVVSQPLASRLGVSTGDQVRIDTLDATVPVSAVTPATGLLGSLDATGLSDRFALLDPRTFAELTDAGWTPTPRSVTLVSLCGTPVTPAAKNQPTQCASDGGTSRFLVGRVESELVEALRTKQAELDAGAQEVVAEVVTSTQTTDVVEFDTGGDVVEEAAPSDGFIVEQNSAADEPAGEPAKPAATDVSNANDPATQKPLSLDVVRVEPVKTYGVLRGAADNVQSAVRQRIAGLLGLGAGLAISAACFVDRRHRVGRERMLGATPTQINGPWFGVVMLTAGPGILLGSLLGTLIAKIGFGGSSGLGQPVRFGSTAATTASIGLVIAAVTCLLLATLTQRIPLPAALYGTPLMSAGRWLLPAIMLLVVGAVIAGWSRFAGARGLGAILVIGVGLAMLCWAMARSRRLVALSALVSSGVGMLLLRRAALAADGGTARMPVVVTVIVGAGVIICGAIGAYVTTAPGQRLTGFGVPRADAAPVALLRSRVTTRPGPWALIPVVGATLGLTASVVGAASVRQAAVPVQPGSTFVEVRESRAGALGAVIDSGGSVAASDVGSSPTIVLPISVGPEQVGLGVRAARRSVLIAALPEAKEQRVALFGEAAGEANVIAVGDQFRSTWETVPGVGTSLVVHGADGAPLPVQVGAVVDHLGVDGALWVTADQFKSLAGPLVVTDRNRFGSRSAERFLVRDRDGRARATLDRAFVGRPVMLGSLQASLPGERWTRATWLVVLLACGIAAVESWRWAEGRRRRMMAAPSAGVGPSTVIRSITQDALAHMLVTALIGGLVGLLIAWAIQVQPGGAGVPLVTMIGIIVGIVCGAALGARVGTTRRLRR